MNSILDVLADNGPVLLLVVTILLGVGWIGGSSCREYVDKQRWAEMVEQLEEPKP